MSLRVIRSSIFGVLLCLLPLSAIGAPNSGKISGVVLDSSGTPQMGATIFVSSDQLLGSSAAELLTNDRGRFSTALLPSGTYSIKVTLAGFLPVVEEHILVNDERTTLLEIVLGSIFSSLERLQRQSDQPIAADEWTWVLRSASATRPVLRWQDDGEIFGVPPGQFETAQNQAGRMRLELTSGSDHPGSVSNPADSPGTALVYDLSLGGHDQLLMASQFSYQSGSYSGGFATQWIPSGEPGVGPVTTILIRQSQLGPDGPTFRGLRMSYDNSFVIGDRISLRYGSDFVMAGLAGTTASVRPRAEMAVQLAPTWQVSVLAAANGWQDSAGDQSTLQSALNTLDQFPILLMRDGHSVLENGLHEELAIEHAFSKNATLTVALFNDRSTQTAVFGHGSVAGPDYLQDFFSNVFAYDAGESSSLGTRVAYHQKFSDNVTATIIYEYAGALSPTEDPSQAALRNQLAMRYRQSVGGRLTARVPRIGTKFTAGYKWINGPVVSAMDPYGESLYHLDPYLSLGIHQPLPSFIPGHAELLADCGNLFAQGYVPLATPDGRVVLIPTYRFIRGGLSFQF
ncbi:MAG: carboxypeptidase-like regulatory domain-containing protein [Candidatus Acidiferrales bacterium]